MSYIEKYDSRTFSGFTGVFGVRSALKKNNQPKKNITSSRNQQRSLLNMEGNVQQQKITPLARELTRIFNSYNKHSIQLKKNLKETNIFFREIRQNYTNVCASTINSDSASLEAGECEHVQQQAFMS